MNRVLHSPAMLSVRNTSIAIVCGLLVGGVGIYLAGTNPVKAYWDMVSNIFTSRVQFREILLITCPLLLNALAACITFKSGVMNIGLDGQFTLGAIFGAAAVMFVPDISIPAMLLAGMLGGALWGLIPAILSTTMGISEVLCTLVLNYVAIYFLQFCLYGPLQDPSNYLPFGIKFPRDLQLPKLGGTGIHIGILIAVILAILMWYLLTQTTLGMKMRAVGYSKDVSKFMGIRTKYITLLVFMISGALCGLSGIIEVDMIHTRLNSGIVGNYGFNGVMIAILARMNPIGAIFFTFFFACLRVGIQSLHSLSGVPVELMDCIQSLIVIGILIVNSVFRSKEKQRQ